VTRLERYILSRQHDDIDQSVLLTEAILFPYPWNNCSLDISEVFYLINLAIFIRAKESRQPKYVECCVACLRYLCVQWREAFNVLLFSATRFLIRALAIQVELELRDVGQDIDKMAGLCDELLNSDTPITSLSDHFARVVSTHPEGPFEGQDPSDKVIGCLRKANMRLPDLHEVSIALADSLYIRLRMTPSDDDYEEGISILEEIINFRGPGGKPSHTGTPHYCLLPIMPKHDLALMDMGSQNIWKR